MESLAKEIELALNDLSLPEKKEFLPSFFKTGKGEYAEGDKFLGVVVPDIRKVAKHYKDISFTDVEELLHNEYHECRICALIILVEKFKKEKDSDTREKIYSFYLSQTLYINNWDLVDVTCKDIVGEYLVDKSDRSILYQLAASSSLWEQRIAVVSTFAFIKRGDFTDILKLSELFLSHPHDLMHKAVGWMLREVGKKDESVLLQFLDKHHKIMPRTMLRYSIEKLTTDERKHYMSK